MSSSYSTKLSNSDPFLWKVGLPIFMGAEQIAFIPWESIPREYSVYFLCVFIILKLLLIDKLVGHGDCTLRVIEMNFLHGNLERSRHVVQHKKR